MAGVKGKSGLKKGQTNNPNGRTPGSKNKVQNIVKKKIEEYFDGDNFDVLITEINALDGKEKVKAKLELLKLVVPRPRDAEETEDILKIQTSFFDKYFNRN